MKKIFKLSFFVFFLFGIGSVKAQIYVGDGIFINNFQPNLVTTNLNVGIGTNTPTEKLHVVGNILATGSISAATMTATVAIPAGTNTSQVATTAFVTTANNLKANIASPLFTGIPAAPTAAATTNTTQLATTAFVATANSLKENILSFTPPLVRNSNTISINNASSSTTGVLTSTDWNTFYNKQNALTLTTNATTGRATLTGSVLNIPEYTGGTQNLQSVTTNGATTTNPIEVRTSDSNYQSITSLLGVTDNGYGVVGFASDEGYGVYGSSTYGIGLQGNSVYYDGVNGFSTNGNGVSGVSYSSTGYGVSASGTNGGFFTSNSNGVAGKFSASTNANGIRIDTPATYSGKAFAIYKSNVLSYEVNSLGETMGAKFIKKNGSKDEFLMADGSTTTASNTSNIYNNDGSLSSPRTVTMGTNPINFNGTGNYIINAGNVGIGTNSPIAKLHVEGDINAAGLARKIGFSVYDVDPLTTRARYGLTQLSNYSVTGETNFTRPGVALSGYFGLSFFTADSEAMRISDWGNVGIGTTTPQVKLDVEGGDFYLGENVASNGLRREFRVYGFDSGNKFYGSAHANYDNDKRTFDISTNNQTEQLKIDASSNANGFISLWPGVSAGVGIGTLTTGSHKLAVEGTIGAREVKVYLGAWSDFVFKKDYNLPTLQEVETHIKDKGHLKDIPSEKEVVLNGVNLGEMNSKLLQKVEELTLYLIQQNKDIELLKAQVKVLTTK